MTERRQTDTIQIGLGIKYAKVSARLLEFLESNPKCSIETSVEFKDGWVLFSAKVTTNRGVFTGHSLGKAGSRDKQFEKQETIAVGRALAFAGYLSSGEIASQEEMDSYRSFDGEVPKQNGAAPNVRPRGTGRPKGDELDSLKKEWIKAAGIDTDQPPHELAKQFAAFVEDALGRRDLPAEMMSDVDKWKRQELETCKAKLAVLETENAAH